MHIDSKIASSRKNSFSFKNLGPIKKANIELNDFTIITGDNNMGKTYLSYAVYYILNRFPQTSIIAVLNKNELADRIERIHEMLSKKSEYLISKEEYRKMCLTFNESFASVYKNSISDFFNVEKGLFKNFSLNLNLNYDFDDITNKSPIKFKLSGNDILISIKKTENREFLDFDRFCMYFFYPNIPKVFLVTAERLGIVLFRKELDERRSNLINLLQKETSPKRRISKDLLFSLVNEYTSRYSNAIHDNINYVRNMFVKKEKVGDFNSENKISTKLQKIMGGNLKSNIETDEIIFFSNRKNNKFSIPLHFASICILSPI